MIDFSKPFQEVHGLPGAKYEQGGVFFDGNGQPSASLQPYEDETPPPDDSSPLPYCTIEEQTSKDAAPVKLHAMTNGYLKAMVETYGGTFTNRQDAIAYLKGKR